MRAVIQRTAYARVTVDGEVAGSIGRGIAALVGFKSGDDDKVMDYMLDKIVNLRIFEDENDKMNLSLADIGGELIIVPNFTLYGDARKGRRPGYSSGAAPAEAAPMFEEFVSMAKKLPFKVESGIFQADMKFELLNDGPVTILLDSDKLF